MTTFWPPIDAATVHSACLLDALREAQRAWIVGLFDPASGGFRSNHHVGVNSMTSTNVAWMSNATGEVDLGDPDRNAWIGYLRSLQDPATGRIRHSAVGGLNHVDGHAFWQVVRALAILGGKLAHFPHHLAPALTIWILQQESP